MANFTKKKKRFLRSYLTLNSKLVLTSSSISFLQGPSYMSTESHTSFLGKPSQRSVYHFSSRSKVLILLKIFTKLASSTNFCWDILHHYCYLFTIYWYKMYLLLLLLLHLHVQCTFSLPVSVHDLVCIMIMFMWYVVTTGYNLALFSIKRLLAS